jgi:hypothetical protein
MVTEDGLTRAQLDALRARHCGEIATESNLCRVIREYDRLAAAGDTLRGLAFQAALTLARQADDAPDGERRILLNDLASELRKAAVGYDQAGLDPHLWPALSRRME